MKKTKIITAALGLCVMASMFAGCGNGGGSTGETAAPSLIEGGQTTIAVEASVSDTVATSGGYTFTHNGYSVGPGMPIDPVLSALGDDYDEEAWANCAYDELGTVYIYDKLDLILREAKGEICEISISGPILDCGGVSVGDSAEAVKAAYGEPFEQTDFIYQYKSDKTILVFELENGKVVGIFYSLDIAAA